MNFSFVQITDHHLRESEALLAHGYSTAYALRAVLRHIAEHVDDRTSFQDGILTSRTFEVPL